MRGDVGDVVRVVLSLAFLVLGIARLRSYGRRR